MGEHIFAKQSDFPFIEDFKKLFPIDENTVFAFDGYIFADKPVPPDIVIHEARHLARQGNDPIGWIEKYLKYPEFRLQEELLAYKSQLSFIKDREARNFCRMEAAANLSNGLYGELITYEEAFKRLK